MFGGINPDTSLHVHKKKLHKLRHVHNSTQRRRGIGENSKTTFPHKLLYQIVVPDHGDSWGRLSWSPYEKTEITVAAAEFLAAH